MINKATPTATLAVTNSPQTYTGGAQAATVSVTTSSVPGAVANVLTGGAATQTNAGTYAVTADFVPTDTHELQHSDGALGRQLRDRQGDADGDAGGDELAADVHGRGPGGDGRDHDQFSAGRSGQRADGRGGDADNAGTYAVTADFVPTDTTNYNTLTSLSAGNFKIDKAASTTTVTFADGPSVIYTGTTHPATAMVTGAGSLNQAVTPVTYNPGDNNAPKDVGSYQASASFLGDANHEPSSGSASLTITVAATTVTISNAAALLSTPTVVGQGYTVEWSVAVVAPGGGTPTGTVEVTGGSTCSASVSTGHCTVISTSPGAKNLVATYTSGDSNFTGSTSAPATHTVNKASTALTIPNAAALASTPTLVGQSYAVQWSVAVTAPGGGSPTGNVTVSDGTATCSAAIAAGSCSVTSATPGLKTVSAIYGGDTNFLGSANTAGHNVQYTFGGFYAPVDNSPVVNKANAGQAIPVKWRLTDTNGVGISDTSSFTSLTAYAIPCNAWASLPTDPQLLDQVSTSGPLYQGNGNWQYNWKTPKNYANTCMVARVTLADGTTHEFNVSFK